MANLSPAAQAVLQAACIHHGLFNEEIVLRRRIIAAALQAAAEEVILPKYQYANWEMAHLIMQEIQAIAAELEGAN